MALVRWLVMPMALLAVVVLSGCGGGGSEGAPTVDTAPTVTDPEGWECHGDQTKYGRCIGNPYFGMTAKQIRAEKEAEGKAQKLFDKKRAAGWNDYGNGISWKWDNSVCTGSYAHCWATRVVSDSGCDVLTVTIDRFTPSDGLVGHTSASAIPVAAGEEVKLQFKAGKGNTAPRT
jgi:hypothetical protein